MKRICEECGAAACEPDDWYCGPCITKMMAEWNDAEQCSDCGELPAELFGICGLCYDTAYNARTSNSSYRKPYDRHWEPAPEPPVPTYEQEHQLLTLATIKETVSA